MKAPPAIADDALMQATFEQTDEHTRLYYGRCQSIFCYFEPRSNGDGSELHVEAGYLTFPWDFENHKDEVRNAVLRDAATRLNVPVEQVLSLPFTQLQQIADPELPEKFRWMSRRRSRSR